MFEDFTTKDRWTGEDVRCVYQATMTAIATRRAEIVLRAMVVRTIRPDTVFIPYHWSGPKSANKLTHRTLDPRSKIPEFKVSACRIRKADAPPEWATR